MFSRTPTNAEFLSHRAPARRSSSWAALLCRQFPLLALALVLGTAIAGSGRALSAVPSGSAVTTAATYGSRLALSRPATTGSRDVLIASVYARLAGSSTITPPSGWTLIRRDSSASGYSSLTQALYYKVATSAEPSAYTWSVGSQASAAGAIMDFKGIDTTSPVDSHSGAFTPRSTSFVAPSVTTTAKNDTVVGFFSTNSTKTLRAPASMAEVFNVRWASRTWSLAGEGAGYVQAVAGPTGTKTATIWGRASGGIGQLLALRGAGTAAPAHRRRHRRRHRRPRHRLLPTATAAASTDTASPAAGEPVA